MRHFTWKLELVLNILWAIADGGSVGQSGEPVADLTKLQQLKYSKQTLVLISFLVVLTKFSFWV